MAPQYPLPYWQQSATVVRVSVGPTTATGWANAIREDDEARKRRVERERQQALKDTKVHVMGPKKARWR